MVRVHPLGNMTVLDKFSNNPNVTSMIVKAKPFPNKGARSKVKGRRNHKCVDPRS